MSICAIIPVLDTPVPGFDDELVELIGVYDTSTAHLCNGSFKSYVFECSDDTVLNPDDLAAEFNLSDLLVVTTDCKSFVDVISVTGEHDGFYTHSISNVASVYGIKFDSIDEEVENDDIDDEWDENWDDDDNEYID